MRNILARRLAEPSTWAGLALVASHAITAWSTRDPVAIAATMGGLAAIIAPEQGGAR